jgi:hypothetical protein
MNIAELKGEKNVKTLAKRLLAEPSKDTPKTTQVEMEAALIRLNPHLSQIGELEKGTPIVVPDGFGRAPEQSTTPTRGLAEELLQRAESVLDTLREGIKEQAETDAQDQRNSEEQVRRFCPKNAIQVYRAAFETASLRAELYPSSMGPH